MSTYTVRIEQSGGSTVVAVDVPSLREARRVARMAYDAQSCRWVTIVRDRDGAQIVASARAGAGLRWA